MATLRQIAAVCGVSPMTVSHVLNNTPGQVGEETRLRVLQAVREMDYRPRTAASRRQAPVRTLGIALGREYATFTGFGYSSSVLQGVINATQQAGLSILLYHSSLFHTDTHHAVRTYLDGQCDGLIVLSPPIGSPLLQVLQERGTPFVVIGDQCPLPLMSFVDVDNVGQAQAATTHLVELGHQRIAFIGGPDFVHANHQRREGYKAALASAGIAYDPQLDLGDLLGEAPVYEQVTNLMKRSDPRPTAFFAWNDGAALRALTALQDLHIQVPRDVSLVGFDDSPPAATSAPPLTTVRQPYQEIGGRAVESLIALIGKSDPRRVALPGRLIVRDSTAPPPPSSAASAT